MRDKLRNGHLLFVTNLLAAITACAPVSSAWPLILPVHISQSYTIRGDSDTPLAATVETAGGVTVYKLVCHNGSYEDTSLINFSGDFHCFLYSVEGNRRTSWNLLATDEPAEQRSDFFNRGRMTANQIWAECGRIPEYGRVRHFRLRGMRIRFEFKDLHWGPATDLKRPRLVGFTFVLDVSPDADATSATAEKIRSAWPGPPCR